MIVTFVRFLIDPFNIFWLLFLACLLTLYFKKEKLLKWMMIITGIWLLIVSTPLIPVALINSLEDRYEPLHVEQLENREAHYHIVVLGGGHGADERLPPNSLLSAQALVRLSEGIRLHRQLPYSKLVLSGFSASGKTSQAEMLQNTALLLGVDEKRTIIHTEPANTYEEARVYKDNFGNGYNVILVTSAAHIPRAILSFEMFNIEPIPSPTNYKLKGSWKKKRVGLPRVENMELFHTAVSEYIAILWYKISKKKELLANNL